jgi:dTDP-4-dehydrorhamnose reductase
VSLNLSGLYHLVGNDRLSKYEFAKMLLNEMDFDQDLLIRGTIETNPLMTNRTRDLSLNNSKLRAKGIAIPGITEGVQDFVHDTFSA